MRKSLPTNLRDSTDRESSTPLRSMRKVLPILSSAPAETEISASFNWTPKSPATNDRAGRETDVSALLLLMSTRPLGVFENTLTPVTFPTDASTGADTDLSAELEKMRREPPTDFKAGSERDSTTLRRNDDEVWGPRNKSPLNVWRASNDRAVRLALESTRKVPSTNESESTERDRRRRLYPTKKPDKPLNRSMLYRQDERATNDTDCSASFEEMVTAPAEVRASSCTNVRASFSRTIREFRSTT
mmetsp:Transcript_7580/g.14783  ORF Transcript_7580/g.14783 Transcript_7580/m.14783 type:complete len:245 (-) Transcript_7580:499-1233(-)